MRNVKMNKDELLAIVRENKAKHIAEYNESVEDYKVLALNITKHNLKLVKTGDLEKIATARNIPSAPRSYEGAYTKAIRMLELSVEEVIEIDETVFNQLVLDEWSWKAAFTADVAMYKTVAF